MTKKYEDEIASSELEKLGVTQPKPKRSYPADQVGNDFDFVDDDIDSIFAEQDNQATLFPDAIPEHLDTRKTKIVDDDKGVIDRESITYTTEEYNDLCNNIFKDVCDLLETRQIIFGTGKASQRLKKILKAYIRTQCVYLDNGFEDTNTEYKKIRVE